MHWPKLRSATALAAALLLGPALCGVAAAQATDAAVGTDGVSISSDAPSASASAGGDSASPVFVPVIDSSQSSIFGTDQPSDVTSDTGVPSATAPNATDVVSALVSSAEVASDASVLPSVSVEPTPILSVSDASDTAVPTTSTASTPETDAASTTSSDAATFTTVTT
ncbi:hypothetical protein HK405_015897 [Cladochytrium tenue]|nr:hypothetical protein HK405_015897 [Cladochytrium tenue]